MTQSTLAPLSARTPPLTRKRKAAMIVQLLIGDGGKLELSKLPEEMQMLLARELGAIRLIDRDTVHEVAAEFTRDLVSVGLSSPGGVNGAIEALSDHLSPNLAGKLRAEMANAEGTDPWSVLLALPDEGLVGIMTTQSVEVGAVSLSKLPVARAAAVLEKLPGDLARRITYAVSQTEKIAPESVQRIGVALVKDHCHSVPVAFDKAPDARIGAILNSSPAQTRDSVLEGLGVDDPVFADSVRKSIFTFKDIPLRLIPTDVPACIRGIPPEVLATAVAGALAGDAELVATAEFILENISQRMAGQIREEADEQGPIKAKVAEEAMRDLSSAVRALADAGTITLITENEDEVDSP
ncbi:MAG: flagellar motor switch protein FliG [Yoonia sp.]|nr:flagellar motor switch protein FliG [Yoonia sp.]